MEKNLEYSLVSYSHCQLKPFQKTWKDLKLLETNMLKSCSGIPLLIADNLVGITLIIEWCNDEQMT